MRTGYPDDTNIDTRTEGIWPVPSLSTNYYRTYLPAVATVLNNTSTTHLPVHILDIGASFGDSLAQFDRALREQIGVTTDTVALDVNRQTLLGTQRRRNADSVVWGWAQDLPFSTETFDIVLAKKLVSFLPPGHQSQILREITRVLVPTGVVGIELDTRGSKTMERSSHWLLSGEALVTLRKETDGFEQYPLPLADMPDCERLLAE